MVLLSWLLLGAVILPGTAWVLALRNMCGALDVTCSVLDVYALVWMLFNVLLSDLCLMNCGLGVSIRVRDVDSLSSLICDVNCTWLS